MYKSITKSYTITGIIPARYASTRLPGKMLIDINGKPMLQLVWEGAKGSEYLDRVVIATDDNRIVELCEKIGAECVMTSPDLKSGSDRVLAACEIIKDESDIIINIQGDEPLLRGEVIDRLISEFADSASPVGTLIYRIDDINELSDDSVVKVVKNKDNTALYFSRNCIPHLRGIDETGYLNNHDYYKHIGIYAFRKEMLRIFHELPESSLEKAEKLEQLRLLENGYSIYCVKTDSRLISVDTERDLEMVRRTLS
jgi:3-deoxy-manno-octulosonate cytidylyltransferase (CMP-KDO synthetase)